MRKDGSIYHDVRARYQCHYNVRHPGECDGQSGYGVKKLDGIIDRIEEELGEKVTVVATGGLARRIVPHCRREIILDDDLLLKGLQILYEKNKR